MFFIIGHRGTGKTSIMGQEAVDLDEYIGDAKFIQNFFLNKGEKAFRKLEFQKLTELLEKKPKVVVLGAGFELEKFNFPPDAKFIWLKRSSDSKLRHFFDRPALKMESDFFERLQKRNIRFQSFADFSLQIYEGPYANKRVQETFKSITSGKALAPSFEQGFYTLKSLKELSFYKGPVELRTDYFTEEEILKVLKSQHFSQHLLAVRSFVSKDFVDEVNALDSLFIDLALEEDFMSGKTFSSKFFSYRSCHKSLRPQDLKKALKDYKNFKYSPVIKSYEELFSIEEQIEGHKVSFLPRAGKDLEQNLKWYRQIRWPKNEINFFNFGLGDYQDQPHYFEALNLENATGYAAVLGENVEDSYSPSFHQDYFERHNLKYLYVGAKREHFDLKVFQKLKEKNIRFWSVTAPYKKILSPFSNEASERPLNTAAFDVAPPRTCNTDELGLEEICKSLRVYSKIAVLGAGDLGKQVFKKLGGRAVLFSVRAYLECPVAVDAEVLVWACGDQKISLKLKENTKLKLLYDLDYKTSSEGRRVALQVGCDYISGLDFFEAQALGQQDFWGLSKTQENEAEQ